MRKSLHELDYMRLIMVVLIVLAHCALFGPYKVFGNTTLYFNRWLCCLVVPYFFTLTGFFIKRSHNVVRTGLKMASRLIKLYVIWNVLYFPVYVLEATKASDKFVYLTGAIKSFVYSKFPLWYLWGCCMGVLLCIGLWKAFKNNVKGLLVAGIVVFLCGSVFRYGILMDADIASKIGSLRVFGNFMLSDDFVRNGFFFGFPFIALGFYLAEREQENKTLGIRGSIIGLICSLIIGLIEVQLSYVASGFKYIVTGNQLKIFAYPTIFFMIELLIKISDLTEAKDTRQIRKLAGLIYLVHWGFRIFIEAFLHAIGTNSYIFNLLSGSITLIISLGFAIIILRLSEKYRFLKKFY